MIFEYIQLMPTAIIVTQILANQIPAYWEHLQVIFAGICNCVAVKPKWKAGSISHSPNFEPNG